MQQMFTCHKCGWQNVIGQRFCGACGERFEYNCPHCGDIVDPSYTACNVCGAELVWGFQQTATPPPEEQVQYQEQPQQANQQSAQQPQQYTEQSQQYQQPPQDQPKAQRQKQKGVPASKEEKLKQRRKNQMMLILISIGLIFCIAVAIYLGIKAL